MGKRRITSRAIYLFAPLFVVFATAVFASGPRYADPTGYAISLYASKADHFGNAKKNGGDLDFTFDGRVDWTVQVSQSGPYRLRLNYACDQPGTTVEVTADGRTMDAALPGTQGYYAISQRNIPRGAVFPHGVPANAQQNYNRLELSGVLRMSQGENHLALAVHMPANRSIFYLRSLELLPVSEEEQANAEVREAEGERANPDWLMHAGYGLMFHWTSQTMPRSGPQLKYSDAVNAFNVPAFAEMVRKTGAAYVIFTANHQDPHFPAPLKEWEAVHPGWTTRRDLIGEIADALRARGIKLILYINTGSMANFYSPAKPGHVNPSESELADTAIKLVSAIGDRYGNRVAGYWFDSFVDIDLQYPHFPYKQFYEACKRGNRQRLVAVTNWIYPIDTPWQDYWGGELFVTGKPPSHMPQMSGPAKGLPFHALLALYGDWVHVWPNTPIKPPIFTVDELSSFINACKGKGAVTLNTGIYQDGSIGQQQEQFFDQLRRRVRGS